MEIMFQTTGKCELKCWFCAYKFLDKKRLDEVNDMYMPLDRFKKYARKCIDFGFDEFQMTPIIGEPLMDTTFFEKIEYLHSFKSLKRVSLFTNFTSFIRLDVNNLKKLLAYPKLTMTISVYGLDEETYKETTGMNLFNRFSNNIERLARLYKPTSIPIEFFIRCPWDGIENKLKSTIKVLSKAKPFHTNYYKRNNLAFLNWNGNWCGLVPDNTFPNQRKDHNREGICWYSLIDNSIDPSGDINLCGACDIEKKTVIGNLNKQSLDEIYSEDSIYAKCLREQHNNKYTGCCKHCSEHHTPQQKTIDEYSRRFEWVKKLISK
jgi:MoaA/NifB/PqqE/SkfB family radical SAM enzyme